MNAIEKLTSAADVEAELAQAVALINADIAHQQAKGQYFTGSLAADTADGAATVEERQAMRRQRYYDTRAQHATLLAQWKATHR
jgi:hypothetical protein